MVGMGAGEAAVKGSGMRAHPLEDIVSKLGATFCREAAIWGLDVEALLTEGTRAGQALLATGRLLLGGGVSAVLTEGTSAKWGATVGREDALGGIAHIVNIV